MIPPLSIDVYPPNTVEGLIARKWVKKIEELSEYANTVNPDFILELIRETHAAMLAAHWTPLYQHAFLTRLRNDLTELTDGLLLTRQFITYLDVELKGN